MTNRPLVDRLCSLSERGYAHRGWYLQAHQQVRHLAGLLGVSTVRCADLLSLFSPRVAVKRSINFTVHYLTTNGEFRQDVTRSVRAAVAYYEQTGIIRGPKTSAFASAIMQDESAVVLDTWMAQAMRVDQREFVRQRYEYHADVVRRVSVRLGIPAARTQAAIWSGIVMEHGRRVPHMSIMDLTPELFL